MENIKNKIIVSVVLSLAIVIIITALTVDATTWESLKEINLVYLIFIGLTLVACWLLHGLRLKVLSKGVGYKLPFLSAVEIGLVDRFFSNITPSGVGGQPFKIYVLTKNNLSSGKASAIVVTEFILRLMFFILSLPLVLFKLNILITADLSVSLLYINLPIFIGVLGVIIYFLLYKPRYLVIIFYWIINRPLLSKIIKKKKRYSLKRKFTREIRTFYKTIWIYLQNGVWNLIAGLLVTIVLWVLRFSILYFIIRGFNLNADLINLLLTQIIIYIVVIFIPVPGGSGIEILLASFLQRTLPVSMLGLIVASWRFFNFYTYIIMGGIVTFKVLHLDPKDIDETQTAQ